MSRFSGKCDIYDTLIEIHGIDDNYDWSKLEMYHEDEKLDIKSIKDLVPYYPYLTAVMCSNRDKIYIRLSQTSFVDRHEREMMNIRLNDVKKYYRKCKRNKTEFIPEEVVKKYSMWGSDNIYLELAKRVKEHPYTQNISGIHSNMAQWYRQELYEEMIKYGYDEDYSRKWCYHE